MGQQSQAQAQAQISALQQQNAMLNQHLHTQAQSHINHLQQLIPFHQPPQPCPPTSAAFQSTPAPQAPDPPTPTATPANQSGSSTTFNPDETLQQMKSTVESSIQAMVEKTQEHQVHPTPPPSLPGATSYQPSSFNLQHPPDLPHGDLTNDQPPSVAVHDADVHQDVPGAHRGIAPAPEAQLVPSTSLLAKIVRGPSLSGLLHLHVEVIDNPLRSTINHMTAPPISQLFRLLLGGKANIPPGTTTQLNG